MTITKAFPLTGTIALQARLGRGSITVRALDDTDEATVTLTARNDRSDIVDRITVEMRGSTLYVTAPREGGLRDLGFLGNRARDAVDVEITVPNRTPTKISSFSADIRLHGQVGDADLAAGAADIDVAEVAGDLRLRYGSGTCTVANVAGSVQARSGSGAARFGTIGGRLNCACGSGELSVREIRGSVHSRAGSGSAALDAVHGDVDVASGSGPISIGLPAGRPAKLDVTTGSGRIDSQLPVEDRPSAAGAPLTIRARTGSGDVHLFRAA